MWLLRNLFSLGSMVQNGKFSAGADDLVRTLKKVDLLQEKIYIHTIQRSHFSLIIPTSILPNIRQAHDATFEGSTESSKQWTKSV